MPGWPFVPAELADRRFGRTGVKIERSAAAERQVERMQRQTQQRASSGEESEWTTRLE